MKTVYLNQKDNYQKNFGIAYRSSSIFYFKKNSNFNTIINFMDYWKLKKSLNVMIIASLRKLNGELVLRETVSLEKGMVVNYTPDIGEEEFEGSLEMEAIANGNLDIPFIAMLVIYENKNSVSMVHGYTRTYSPHEIEEKKTITVGEECGLTMRDNKDIRSFIIGHNGIYEEPEQNILMIIHNSNNQKLEKKIKLKKLSKYETFKIYPSDHFEGLEKFLDNKPGSCSFSFNLNGGFTRTVVGNETKDGTEMQVYHSDFNFAKHEPGYVDKEDCYFSYPICEEHIDQIVHMEPSTANGKYILHHDNNNYEFNPNNRLDIKMTSEILKIERLDGKMPARINLAFSAKLKNAKCTLPMESARGFYHSKRPPKFRMWMVAAIGKKYRSKLFVHSITDLYGQVKDSILSIKLFRENGFEPIEKKFNSEQLKDLEKGKYVDEIFPEVSNLNENEIGQLWCHASKYGGHQGFTTIEASNGSSSIEHNY